MRFEEGQTAKLSQEVNLEKFAAIKGGNCLPLLQFMLKGSIWVPYKM